jgi:hypothetical protein
MELLFAQCCGISLSTKHTDKPGMHVFGVLCSAVRTLYMIQLTVRTQAENHWNEPQALRYMRLTHINDLILGLVWVLSSWLEPYVNTLKGWRCLAIITGQQKDSGLLQYCSLRQRVLQGV